MPGLWIAPGKQHAGEVEVVDIGIPATASPVAPYGRLIGARHPCTPIRAAGADSTKFASGHVLVAGGSRGLTGAPCLSSMAAMRAGAGYVTACVPDALNDIFEIKLTEVMSVPLPDDGRRRTPRPGADEVLEARGARRRARARPGPGADRRRVRVRARGWRARREVALVLDADGLNAHAGDAGGAARRARRPRS